MMSVADWEGQARYVPCYLASAFVEPIGKPETNVDSKERGPHTLLKH